MTTARLFAIILMMASLFMTCESKKCELKNKKLASKIKLYKHDCLERGFTSTIGCPSTKMQPKKSVIKKCKKIENSLKKCDYTCPHDGGWTDFSEWTACSADCDGGNQTRSRECTNPAPAFGGKDCEGSAEETRDCNTHSCAGYCVTTSNKLNTPFYMDTLSLVMDYMKQTTVLKPKINFTDL